MMAEKEKIKTLAIITARGGSKRIPRKNIQIFSGKPIIEYSISAALNCESIDRVIVSTDDQEIADISSKMGADIPFLRSEKNANDHAMIIDVILEVIDNLQRSENIMHDYICCILPTAPFITSFRLGDSFHKLITANGEALIPVVKFSFPIQRAFKISDNMLKMFQPEYMHTRSQDLPSAYHDVGQFYWLKVSELLKQKKVFLEKSIPYELPELETQDIDTMEDWKIAEVKFKILQEKNISAQ